MIPPINKRIKEIIIQTKLSNNQFAQSINTSSAVISHITTGRNKPNIDLVVKILETYVNINPSWLIMGKGEMLIDVNEKIGGSLSANSSKTKSTEKVVTNENLKNEIDDNQILILWEIVETQLNTIKELQQTLEKEHKLLSIFFSKKKES